MEQSPKPHELAFQSITRQEGLKDLQKLPENIEEVVATPTPWDELLKKRREFEATSEYDYHYKRIHSEWVKLETQATDGLPGFLVPILNTNAAADAFMEFYAVAHNDIVARDSKQREAYGSGKDVPKLVSTIPHYYPYPGDLVDLLREKGNNKYAACYPAFLQIFYGERWEKYSEVIGFTGFDCTENSPA